MNEAAILAAPSSISSWSGSIRWRRLAASVWATDTLSTKPITESSRAGTASFCHRPGSNSGTLNPDNTGLLGWPYWSEGENGSDIFDANLSGAYRVAKRATQGMLRARKGRIIFLSSVVGLLGSAGQVNYAASKAGLVGLARSLARELASRSITANVVAPEPVSTDTAPPAATPLPVAAEQAVKPATAEPAAVSTVASPMVPAGFLPPPMTDMTHLNGHAFTSGGTR